VAEKTMVLVDVTWHRHACPQDNAIAGGRRRGSARGRRAAHGRYRRTADGNAGVGLAKTSKTVMRPARHRERGPLEGVGCSAPKLCFLNEKPKPARGAGRQSTLKVLDAFSGHSRW